MGVWRGPDAASRASVFWDCCFAFRKFSWYIGNIFTNSVASSDVGEQINRVRRVDDWCFEKGAVIMQISFIIESLDRAT